MPSRLRVSVPMLLLVAMYAVFSECRVQAAIPPFATPLNSTSIDGAVCAEWVDGAEHPYANLPLLLQIGWTQTAPSSLQPVIFGDSSNPGTRHLRIAFSTQITVGTILVRGGGIPSVLRSTAAYPGNLADDQQWLSARRILNGQLSTTEVDPTGYALWIFPPGTIIRALRFTHTAVTTDARYAGQLGGFFLLPDRIANLAPQAIVTASKNARATPLLTDEKDNGWLSWDNGPEFSHTITTATPEWIMLTWPQPVSLSGLATLWSAFNAADVQAYVGHDSLQPQEAPDSAWQSIGATYTLRNQYPRGLGVDWLDFGRTITTRAVRLRMTQVTDESHHSHLTGKTRNGMRLWLGELMAIAPLASSNIQLAILPTPAKSNPHPPIPIQFNLAAAGYITLVIEDTKGDRVRNLISDTWFDSGPNTVWWDGTDDLGRNQDAANHAVYLIPTHFVAPGSYQARGLYHKSIDLHYKFSVYNSGHPAWDTADGKGGWLTNHTPPSSALFVPADKAPGAKPLIYLGSFVSEGGSGLAWVNLNGVKQGGRGWVGGNWTGAYFLARDIGSSADNSTYAYVASPWSEDAPKDPKHPRATIRITALTNHGDRTVPSYLFDPADTLEHDDTGRAVFTHQMGGIAVYNNLIAISLTLQHQLILLDANTGQVMVNLPVDADPRGVVFDASGRLLALIGTRLVRYTLLAKIGQLHADHLSAPEEIVSKLQDPTGITLDSIGNIYVSDRGNSSQIKVFSPEGTLLRAIGHPGAPQAGPYDELHMNNPRGITIDSNEHLWVAEEDFQPKRVSVWTLDGKFVQAFYGPSEYGGGGTIDPHDKTHFYYHGMQFSLDWNAGTSRVESILYRDGTNTQPMPRFSYPGTAIYKNGHRYFTNCFTGHSTDGTSIAMIYIDKNGTLQPVAAIGKASEWPVLSNPAFRSDMKANAHLTGNNPQNEMLFSWSDLNDNGKADPGEVVFRKAVTGWLTVTSDLTILDAFVDGKSMQYTPLRFTLNGIPLFDLDKGQVIASGAQLPFSDGGGQILKTNQGIIMTTAPLPYPVQALGGIDSQGHHWSYPSLWPGLHPSHNAPLPEVPGILTGTTHLLGDIIQPAGSNAGPLWAINSNFGQMYVFTSDGLFVTQLFQDLRKGKTWTMPNAPRNMLLNDVSPSDENFFPSITQTSDGNIYIVDGRRTSIVRVEGLDTIRSLPSIPVQVTADQLQKAAEGIKSNEAIRQQLTGPKVLAVNIQSTIPPNLEMLTNQFASAAWATIDSRTNRVGWGDTPDVAEAAVTIAGGSLFAAYRTHDAKLLTNSGAVANSPFKSGGALDLMIGMDPHANPTRIAPVAGDIRLLVYQVNGIPRALIYRPVSPGSKNPIPFSSPSRTITIDQVQDVTSQLNFASQGGNYEFSIPLVTLGLHPTTGLRIKADIGILRGNGTQTTQRIYWSNKATGITSDVPSEAELTPNLWGEWLFTDQP